MNSANALLLFLLVSVGAILAVAFLYGPARNTGRAHPSPKPAPAPATARGAATSTALRRIARAPADDAERTIHWASILIGYLQNDGLDTFISATHHKEWGLEPFTTALGQLDAGPVAKILQRAEQVYVGFANENDADPAGLDSPGLRARTEAYLARMYALEEEIGAEPSLKERLEVYAAQNPASRA